VPRGPCGNSIFVSSLLFARCSGLGIRHRHGCRREKAVDELQFSRRTSIEATLRGAFCLTHAVSPMKDLLLVPLHLAVVTAKLCGPGGVRAVIAENLLLKQQLIVLRRARHRAPNLTLSARLLCGFGSLFLSAERIRKLAIGIRPSTLLAFHRALVRGKYRRLFSSSPRPKKPGPTGPSEALIQAIVELKSRNPRFGCPRIARIISHTFGVDIDKNVVYRVLAKHHRPPVEAGPRGCRSSDTRQTACGAWTCFDANPSCSGAIGCSWSWTSSRVASSESVCTATR
jgi:hypothetical protein